MTYTVMTTKRFERELRKLDHYTQRMIKHWIKTNLDGTDNPRRIGKALTGTRSGQWRYRIGDYRLICEVKDSELVIIALAVGHRKDIYRK